MIYHPLTISKKVLIANVLGKGVAEIFGENDYSSLPFTNAWIGMIAYSFQIYFDFSGYSDMAIGLGKMFGFQFPENFNLPYISKSITEFWKRWHMTLGSFFKDYLYIPLGGNRLGIKRGYFNLALVFLVSGLWHGASWNFVIWGIYHGSFLVLDRLFLLRLINNTNILISTTINFIIVLIGWVFFKFENLTQIKQVLLALINYQNQTDIIHSNHFLATVCIVLLATFLSIQENCSRLFLSIYTIPKKGYLLAIKSVLLLFLFFICVGQLTLSGFNPFIYFKF